MPELLRFIPGEDEAPPGLAGNGEKGTSDVLLFFISGNPGLPGFYAPFLSTLYRILEEQSIGKDKNIAFHVYGRGLKGFQDADHEPFSAEHPPFDLECQISDVLDCLAHMTVEAPRQRRGRQFDKIILMGHSVGAYILLEIFNRLMQNPSMAPGLNLRAGILLFPTVTHLTQSPSGQRVERLRSTMLGSLLLTHLHRLASTVFWLWPTWALHWLVRHGLGFPPSAADVTVRFLKSRDGVWQALHLGMDELRIITEDKWSEELWELPANAEGSKFFFYWGKHDHWVANEFRSRFIAAREEHARRAGPRHKQGRTKIVVAEDDIPHAFCIDHSETVAERVSPWIWEIV